MILNLGKAFWLHKKDADGMVDISPFSCMDRIPIGNFYFDGTQTNLDEGVGIFMELAAHYSRNKKHQRRVPSYFDPSHRVRDVA